MPPSIHWHDGQQSDNSSTNSGRSDGDRSYESQSTAPTDYVSQPYLPRYNTCYARLEGGGEDYFQHDQVDDGRASVETYASTVASEEDLPEYDVPEYDAPFYGHELHPTDAVPATPRDFAELFPSTGRLCICHDDATIDGNMNLRIDTQVTMRSGKKRNMTLFHLRMHDLKNREFSLRRYCRESGREVCHSVRKYQAPASTKRPTLQKSFSTALASLRAMSEPKTATLASLKRQDSGYESMYGNDNDNDDSQSSATQPPGKAPTMPTETISLEFSNYAHVDVKRRGTGSNKRYEFEYWGINYAWKRSVKKNGDREEVSYHLVRLDSTQPLAHIVPVPLTTAQADEEDAKGGWIPPCSMWITDKKIISGLSDVPDVIVASGLMALVDDSIKRRFHSKQTRRLQIPLSRSSSYKMEYIGPKRLIDEIFNRAPRSPTKQSSVGRRQ